MGKKYSIQVDDGRSEIDVFDSRNKKLGTLYINPMDFNILGRLEKAETTINNTIKSTQLIVKKDADTKEVTAAVSKADKLIKKQLDYIFDYEVSQTIFKQQNCMNIYKGRTYIERFLEAITPVIQDITNAEAEVTESHIKKHTEKYAKQ